MPHKSRKFFFLFYLVLSTYFPKYKLKKFFIVLWLNLELIPALKNSRFCSLSLMYHHYHLQELGHRPVLTSWSTQRFLGLPQSLFPRGVLLVVVCVAYVGSGPTNPVRIPGFYLLYKKNSVLRVYLHLLFYKKLYSLL